MIEEKTIKTGHWSINVIDTGGENFPIVLLHGSASSSAVFDRQLVSPLSDQFRLIAIDLPGHGRTSDALSPSTEYSIQGLAKTVHAALTALKIPRAVVFGWSLGGHVAIELTASTGLVAGLMLSGAPPIPQGRLGLLRGFQLSKDILLASKAVYSAADAARMVHLTIGNDAPKGALETALRADGRLRANVSKSFLHGSGMSDQRHTLETTSVPVAIIEGDEDPFVRVGYSASLNIPTLWDRKILAHTGHACFWQRPETFNVFLQQFAFAVAHGQTDHSRLPSTSRVRRVSSGR